MSIMIRNYTLMLAMLVSMVLAIVMRPSLKLANKQQKFDLETMIPKTFGQWQIDTNLGTLVVSPDSKELINKIYNQTLSRTYINRNGRRIMLSIAYGSNQNDAMQVHKPEICYTAQGFQIEKQTNTSLKIIEDVILIKQLVAVHGNRIEPLTYWIRVGDKTINDELSRKIAQLKYTITGVIPDGVIFRVSTLGRETSEELFIQEEFIRDLLINLSDENKVFLIGNSVER